MSLDKFTPNFDFASLYPSTMIDYSGGEGFDTLLRMMKMKERKKKLDKILDRMNNGQV